MVTKKITIIKLSESPMSILGISKLICDDNAHIEPTSYKLNKIEFIGDSITCGYGVEDENPEHHFVTSTENVMKAYAYKTAEILDADYSMVSASGYGIISGFTPDGERHELQERQLIPLYYETMGFSEGSLNNKYPQALKWDFSSFIPNIIVINLGTNDTSYCKLNINRQREYIEQYVEFLKVIRSNNPFATIICTLGIMGRILCHSIKKAVKKYKKETNDKNIHTCMFPAEEETAEKPNQLHSGAVRGTGER